MIIKIVLIDDHELVLEGLKNRLEATPDFEIVGAYTKVESLILCLKHQAVDVIVMDLMLKGTNGFELVNRIKQMTIKQPNVVLISGFYEEMLHKRALELGIKAFLRKEASYEELIGCIVNVASGNHVVPDFLIAQTDTSILSETELSVLKLLVDEYTNEKISKELFISRRTVESHVANICSKLNVSTRIGAVREAIKLNLVK